MAGVFRAGFLAILRAFRRAKSIHRNGGIQHDQKALEHDQAFAPQVETAIQGDHLQLGDGSCWEQTSADYQPAPDEKTFEVRVPGGILEKWKQIR